MTCAHALALCSLPGVTHRDPEPGLGPERARGAARTGFGLRTENPTLWKWSVAPADTAGRWADHNGTVVGLQWHVVG